MRNRFLSLLLLLVFGGGLLAGPHPCQAQGTPLDSSKESKPACHGHEATPISNDGQRSSSSGEHEDDCCTGEQGSLCEHACQMVALVRVQILGFAVQPQAQMVVPAFDRSLPLFAPPIDHIPLA